jgi:thioredoxin reductase
LLKILNMITETSFDVIIVGGSYAGLSAALALGRSLRKVLVIDSGLPCNRYTPHSQNFLTQDGAIPAEIAALGKRQVMRYETVRFVDGLATGAVRAGNGFQVHLQTGEKFHAAKLMLATGIRDVFPEIKGFAECWGISVIHCPYCHGYEYRNKRTAILANGDRALHLAGLVSNLTGNDRTVLTNGTPDFTAEQLEKLQRAGIRVFDKKIQEVIHQNGMISQVVFVDGARLDLDVMYAAIPFEQHSSIPGSLGCEITGTGHIRIDDMQKTTVPGVFAVGDNSSPLRSVANAVAAGNRAGAMINAELVNEQF